MNSKKLASDMLDRTQNSILNDVTELAYTAHIHPWQLPVVTSLTQSRDKISTANCVLGVPNGPNQA